MAKSALICGVSGQDGAYLARLLLNKGYSVWGTSRDAEANTFASLIKLGIKDQVNTLSMAPTDFRSVLASVNMASPDEIYALSGQSSVGLSFDIPAQTLESIVFGTLNLLEAVRITNPDIKIYHASSSECFGDLRRVPANENTPFAPKSPYGVAKASAHMLVKNYREAYDLFAVNGQLFNHESPLRPARFVTRKICAAAARISAGSKERLSLGPIDITRDWGWAPEYVEAMWQMLQIPDPEDFLIATGSSFSLEDFVTASFESVGLDWRAHVDSDPSLRRPAEIGWSGADPSKAQDKLGWRATTIMPEVAARMVAAECG